MVPGQGPRSPPGIQPIGQARQLNAASLSVHRGYFEVAIRLHEVGQRGCEKPEPQTTSQGPNPTAPQASSDLLRDTQPTQGTLQCVHLRMSIFFKLHRSILLKVSRKQVWFVRKRRSNDSRKANEPNVDSIGPKSHPLVTSNPSNSIKITEISSVPPL